MSRSRCFFGHIANVRGQPCLFPTPVPFPPQSFPISISGIPNHASSLDFDLKPSKSIHLDRSKRIQELEKEKESERERKMMMMMKEMEKMNGKVLDDIIKRLLEGKGGKQAQLSEAEIRQLCASARQIFLSQPILLQLRAPIKICGQFLHPYIH